MVSQRIGAFVQHVTDRLLDTDEGDTLFCEIDNAYPELTIKNDSSVIQAIAAPLAFEYPNTIELAGGALPIKSRDGFDFDENKIVEAKFALGYVHELLHRIQSTKTGLDDFFKGRFQPNHLMHAELLIEAENYARTAQIGWRIGHDDNTPYKEISNYMLSSDANNHTESSYAVYASYMKDKQQTEENELNAMKHVVEDFLFSSANAQRYLSRRITETHDYLNSGRLNKELSRHDTTELARAWMDAQPQIAGMGPNAAEYNPEKILDLGKHSSGNLFELENGWLEKLANPNMVNAFITDDEQQKLGLITAYISKLKTALEDSEVTHDNECNL